MNPASSDVGAVTSSPSIAAAPGAKYGGFKEFFRHSGRHDINILRQPPLADGLVAHLSERVMKT